jgi:hypothetical protein
MHPSIVLLPFPMHGTLAMVAEPGAMEGKIEIMPAVIQYRIMRLRFVCDSLSASLYGTEGDVKDERR